MAGVILMNKKLKVILVFVVSFIVAYLIVGYYKNAVCTSIHWIEGVTIWGKLREYYIRTFFENLPYALVLALIPTLITAITTFHKKAVKN